jgi:hypothetical protein
LHESDARSVEVSAFESDGALRGFLVCGRWPDTTIEWTKFLTLAVRMASVPGLLPTTTIFRVREELPQDPAPGTVGLVLAEGTVTGAGALGPGSFADSQPPGLLVLHPPSETRPSLPECEGVASGCVLLPGLPHLGMDHRAAWVQAHHSGTVTSLVARSGVDPNADPDTAVLAMLLAA